MGQILSIQRREEEFWDQRVGQSCRDLDPEVYRVNPDDAYDRAMPWLPYMGIARLLESLLEALGDLQGKRILDIGSGTGFLSSALAQRGARVDSIDISEKSLDVARWRAKISGVEDSITFHKMAVETLDFPDQTFDAAAGVFILHHLDLNQAGSEIHRVLKPDTPAAFVETSAKNRLLMFCRKTILGRFGTERAGSKDEQPLDAHAKKILSNQFPNGLDYRYPELIFFRMIAGSVPLFRIFPLKWLMRALDKTIGLVPPLRHSAYYFLVEMHKQP